MAQGIPRKGSLPDHHRSAIKTSMIINRVQDHIDGKVEMSATQVRCADILLKKVVPDLSAITLAGDPDNKTPIPLAMPSLADILAKVKL